MTGRPVAQIAVAKRDAGRGHNAGLARANTGTPPGRSAGNEIKRRLFALRFPCALLCAVWYDAYFLVYTNVFVTFPSTIANINWFVDQVI